MNCFTRKTNGFTRKTLVARRQSGRNTPLRETNHFTCNTVCIMRKTICFTRKRKKYYYILMHCFARKVNSFTRKVNCFTRKDKCFTRKTLHK